MKNRGFTLIELLIVIAIIGILAAILAPAIANTRERAHMSGCLNNMKQLAVAAFMYADDHSEIIPDVSNDMDQYIDNDDVFLCPRDERPELETMPFKTSYTAHLATPASLHPADKFTSYSEMFLYIESGKAGLNQRNQIFLNDISLRHANSSVIVFADGHVLCATREVLASAYDIVIP